MVLNYILVGCPYEICNFLFEYYFGRVCSEKSEGFPFNEAFFNSLRVTGTKMGILKCLSWFKMSTHIKDCVSLLAEVSHDDCLVVRDLC